MPCVWSLAVYKLLWRHIPHEADFASVELYAYQNILLDMQLVKLLWSFCDVVWSWLLGSSFLSHLGGTLLQVSINLCLWLPLNNLFQRVKGYKAIHNLWLPLLGVGKDKVVLESCLPPVLSLGADQQKAQGTLRSASHQSPPSGCLLGLLTERAFVVLELHKVGSQCVTRWCSDWYMSKLNYGAGWGYSLNVLGYTMSSCHLLGACTLLWWDRVSENCQGEVSRDYQDQIAQDLTMWR